MTADHQLMEPSEAFAQLGRIRLADADISGVLDQVATLARRTIPGAAEVSVTLVRNDKAHNAAFTGDLALGLDESQYERGYGPCLDASQSAATMSVPDMAAEERWPEFAADALKAGCHSSLSLGLPVQEVVSGALNIYSTKPAAFDDDAIVVAQTFAGYAAVALANANLYDAQATLAKQMQAAMESRSVIEQAKGIVMGQRRCSADDAFKILSTASQDTNRKLRDIAVALVESTVDGPRNSRP